MHTAAWTLEPFVCFEGLPANVLFGGGRGYLEGRNAAEEVTGLDPGGRTSQVLTYAPAWSVCASIAATSPGRSASRNSAYFLWTRRLTSSMSTSANSSCRRNGFS